MGRNKGKGKKQTVVSDHIGSAKEEKIPASKRRGRPHRPLKDEVEDEEIEKIANGGESAKSSITSKSSKGEIVVESGAKRKRSSQVKTNSESVKEENGLKGKKSSDESSVKSVGFRHNGSRRKNKPRRAAEVGVECK